MIYLFVGPDEYLKSDGAKKLIEKLVPPDNRDFGLEIIEGSCNNAEETLAAVNRTEEALFTDGFLGNDGKTVWLRDANFLPGAKGRGAESQAAKDRVARWTDLLQTHALPDGHHLIITANTCPANTKFGKWVRANANVTICGEEVLPWQKDQAAADRIAALLPQSGLRMNTAVRAAFAQRVGTDSRTVVSELEKLRTYLGDETVDVPMEAVETITSAGSGSDPFALAGAIQARNPAQVVKIIAQLRLDKNAAFPAAASVLNLMNDLCCVRDALDRGLLDRSGWRTDRVPTRLTRLRGFALGKTIDAANRYTLNELRAGRHFAVEMRFALVDSTLRSPWDIIEPALLRIVARSPRRRC